MPMKPVKYKSFIKCVAPADHQSSNTWLPQHHGTHWSCSLGRWVSGGRNSSRVLAEPSCLLSPKSTQLSGCQMYTLYFNNFLSFCKLKYCMWDSVNLGCSKNTKGKSKHFSSGTLHLGESDLLASPEPTSLPAHRPFLIHFSCSSLPGGI